MFTRKFIAVCIASLLALSLVSCGDSNKKSDPSPASTSKSSQKSVSNNESSPPTQSPAPERHTPGVDSNDEAQSVLGISNGSATRSNDQNDETSDGQSGEEAVDTAQLERDINNNITEFDHFKASIDEMIDVAAGLESDDEIMRWCQQFNSLKDSINLASDTLINSIGQLPSAMQSQYRDCADSAIEINELALEFGQIADSAIYGDIQSFQQNIGSFQADFFNAGDEWYNSITVLNI